MFNKVTLIGNLGKKPEIRTLDNGVVVCRFPIATTETYKNRKSGKKTNHTEWHTIVLWRGLAEVAEKYLKKGDLILIEGRIRYRSWEDKESGQKRYITEILADLTYCNIPYLFSFSYKSSSSKPLPDFSITKNSGLTVTITALLSLIIFCIFRSSKRRDDLILNMQDS